MQSMFNPRGERVKGNRFRVNDKVICTGNSMLPLVVEEFDESPFPTEPVDGITSLVNQLEEPQKDAGEQKEFVANGEIGRVGRVEPRTVRSSEGVA